MTSHTLNRKIGFCAYCGTKRRRRGPAPCPGCARTVTMSALSGMRWDNDDPVQGCVACGKEIPVPVEYCPWCGQAVSVWGIRQSDVVLIDSLVPVPSSCRYSEDIVLSLVRRYREWVEFPPAPSLADHALHREYNALLAACRALLVLILEPSLLGVPQGEAPSPFLVKRLRDTLLEVRLRSCSVLVRWQGQLLAGPSEASEAVSRSELVRVMRNFAVEPHDVRGEREESPGLYEHFLAYHLTDGSFDEATTSSIREDMDAISLYRRGQAVVDDPSRAHHRLEAAVRAWCRAHQGAIGT